MKRKLLTPLLYAALFMAAIQLPACKGKKTETVTDSVAKDTVAKPAPVVIAADDELVKNTKDATKDFPGVNAEVKDGEINLSGNITREKLQQLMMNLNELHPKKINNNLTINK